MVGASIMHTKGLLYDRTSSFLAWGGIRATTGELWPRNGAPAHTTLSFSNFCGFCLRVPGVARIVRPHLDYWTRAFYSVGWLWICRSSTIVFSIYLLLKTNLMPWKTPLCIYIPFGSPQRDSACSWRWVVVTSNHLGISFVGSPW